MKITQVWSLICALYFDTELNVKPLPVTSIVVNVIDARMELQIILNKILKF